MARILISCGVEELSLVSQYKERLTRYGHEIILWTRSTSNQEISKDLHDLVRQSDGSLFFVFESSIDLQQTKRELDFLKSNLRTAHKFLFPVVRTSVSAYGLFKGLDIIIEIGGSNIEALIPLIHNRIIRAMAVSPNTSKTNQPSKQKSDHIGPVKSLKTDQPPTPALDHIGFVKSLFSYMDSLGGGYVIGQWVCKGRTEIAYGTPVGPWDQPGFLFESQDYSFIVRSAWKDNERWAYLVIESNKLKGQLVNHKLQEPGKYLNKNGVITIREMYDMTVGLGRRSREEVQEALQSVGMSTDVISIFHEDDHHWNKVILDILQWAIYREEAKKIMQARKTAEEEPKYWLLKIFGRNWDLPNVKIGDTAFFSAYNDSKIPRPDYKEFETLEVGEKGVAFDFSEKKETVFSFEITQQLHTDDNEEIFHFKITGIPVNIFNTQTLSGFINKDLLENSDRRIFEIPKQVYDDIVDFLTPKRTGTTWLKPTLSKIFADTASKDIPDELEFTSDVNALASVIALREVTPPLAIGLFGNWGSGKSFFINKLQERINFLTEDPGTTFCKKVLQINFNSWHYSDSNLWASLITKIFEALEEYGNQKPDELKELFKNLNSTKELLAETKIEKEKIDKQIQDLTQEKGIQDREIKKQSEELTSLSPREILNGILENSTTKEEFEKLKNEYSFLNIKEIDDIKKRTDELNDFSGKCLMIWMHLRSYTKSPNLIFALSAFAIISLSVYFLIGFADFVKSHQGIFIQLAATISSFLLLTRTYLASTIKAVKKIHFRLASLNTTIVKLKEQASEKFKDRQEELKDKISKAKLGSDEVQKKIELLEIQSNSLKTEIDEITSGKKIIRFIESRVSDIRYINSLGIISWIRKDFEQLDRLLSQQNEALKKNNNIGQTTASFQLERIILYIDDLDRCNEAIVLQVLQAINLLLAFPLFVVIVGVDPRWMNNALNKIYPHFLGKENLNGNDRHSNVLPTSFDYLEKIFQIPLSLKRMDKKGKMKLIASQLKGNLLPGLTSSAIPSSIAPAAPAKSIVPLPDDVEQKDLVNEIEQALSEPANHESLLISDKEIEFMQAIHFLIGESPRIIKRFINIYRIIRTHTQFEHDVTDDTGDYFAAMIVLGITTGQPHAAQTFCQRVSDCNQNDLFQTFLEDYLVTPENAIEALKTLSEELRNPDSKLQPLTSLSMNRFKRNMELVRRFSFRHDLTANSNKLVNATHQ